MTKRLTMLRGFSALALGTLIAGCTTGDYAGIASARDAAASGQHKASGFASRAFKSLRQGKGLDAIGYAEQAVMFAPRVAKYRKLLANAYLQTGRFGSARQAYADAVELDSHDGKSALNLALCAIALGDSASARTILAGSAAIIPAEDLGLAMSLAGDVEGGVALLSETARANREAVQARQNLALSLAMAGQWQAAKLVAERDLSADQVDRRMEQWAAFVTSASSDRVAALLGVHPIADAGQPVALALRGAPTLAPPQPERLASFGLLPIPEALAALLPKTPKHVAFAAPRAVVQPLPPAIPWPKRVGATPVINSPADQASMINWYVQLGAYQNAADAREGWKRITRDNHFLAAHRPNGTIYAKASRRFYRLSIGGFARADGVSLCQRYRQHGGSCFVRRGAGDQIAAWVNPSVQSAARGI